MMRWLWQFQSERLRRLGIVASPVLFFAGGLLAYESTAWPIDANHISANGLVFCYFLTVEVTDPITLEGTHGVRAQWTSPSYSAGLECELTGVAQSVELA
jgi:hypothetical protein